MSRPPLTEEQKRRGMRRDLTYLAVGGLLMAVGALLWTRAVVVCERTKPGESATCVVTQKRLFGLVPFTSLTVDRVVRATHDVFGGYTSPSQPRPSQPSYMLVLEGRALRQPIESSWSGAVGAAEAELNALLLTPAAGRASAAIGVWVPSVLVLVVGLLPTFHGGQRALVRWRGGDPDARRRKRRR